MNKNNDDLDVLIRKYAEKFNEPVPICHYGPDELEKLLRKALETGEPIPPAKIDPNVFL